MRDHNDQTGILAIAAGLCSLTKAVTEYREAAYAHLKHSEHTPITARVCTLRGSELLDDNTLGPTIELYDDDVVLWLVPNTNGWYVGEHYLVHEDELGFAVYDDLDVVLTKEVDERAALIAALESVVAV